MKPTLEKAIKTAINILSTQEGCLSEKRDFQCSECPILYESGDIMCMPITGGIPVVGETAIHNIRGSKYELWFSNWLKKNTKQEQPEFEF